MKKLIATMIISMIMGQPILAGPLSMDIMAVNGTAQGGRGDSSSAYSLQRGANRTRVLGRIGLGSDLASRWISGVGVGTLVAFSLVSWFQFDRASDYEAEAALNRELGQLFLAEKFDNKADRARLYGWSAAVLAAGSLGMVLIGKKKAKKAPAVFPSLSFRDGEPHVGVSYAYSF